MPTVKPGEWFQETESAGSTRAWQTYYPAIGNFRSRDQQLAPWHGSAQGTFQESYAPDEKLERYYTMTKAKNPAWFDNSVSQYDAFGRGKLPSEDSRERYVEYTQKYYNKTVVCKQPGCEVNTSMTIFDHTAEAHLDCKLNLLVHPTDFDDEFSREYVELVQVNGKMFNFRCHPQAPTRTCGASGNDALIPCVKDISLDGIVKANGVLNLTTRISPMVDECPVKGNLFSGVAVVTCMVHPSWDNKYRPAAGDSFWRPPPTPPRGSRLRCKEPGCTARATVLLSEKDTKNKTCRLTITVAQTDFDGNLGSKEEIEWVKVNGNITKAHVKPGRNPCKEQLLAQQGVAEDGSDTGNSSSGSSGNSTGGNSGASAGNISSGSSGNSTGGNSGATAGNSSSGSSGNSTGGKSGASASSAKGGNAAGGTSGKNGAGSAGSAKGGNAAGGTSGKTGSSGDSSAKGGTAAGGAKGNTAAKKAAGIQAANASSAMKSPSGGAKGAAPGGLNASGSAGGNASSASGSAGSNASGNVSGNVSGNASAAGPLAYNASRLFGSNASNASDAEDGGTVEPSVISSIFGTAGLSNAAPPSYSDGGDNTSDWYVVLNGTDVTAEAQDGKVEISAKISGMVDECGSNGFLLDGQAVIECS